MAPLHTPCFSDHDSESQTNHHPSYSTSLYSHQGLLPSISSLHSVHQHEHNQYHHYCCITTLKGQNSYISSLALAGKFLYSGSSDREIRIWKHGAFDAAEFRDENISDNMIVVTAGKGAVKSLVVLPDKIFSAHQDHKIRAWKIENQEDHHHHHQKFTHLATLPTLSDRAFKVLLPKNHVQVRRHKKCTWIHHVDTVSALALSRDELLLYSVSWDRSLKIWRTADFKCLESVANAHDDAINTLALSNDGHVYTGSSDKKIKVWMRNSGDEKHSLVATLEKHKSGINALALSTDGSLLYSGASDKSIVVWEKDGGGGSMAAVQALRGHTKSILCLAVVSDLMCSGSADNTIRIWRRVEKTHSCLAVMEGHHGPVKCLTMATDHQNSSDTTVSYLIYSGSLDCDIKVWQISIPQY